MAVQVAYKDDIALSVADDIKRLVVPEGASTESVEGRVAVGWTRTSAGVYAPPSDASVLKQKADDIASEFCWAVETIKPHIDFWGTNGSNSLLRATNTYTRWLNKYGLALYYYRQYGTAQQYYDFMVLVEKETKLGETFLTRKARFANVWLNGVWGWYGGHNPTVWQEDTTTIYFTNPDGGGWSGSNVTFLPAGADLTAAKAAYGNTTSLFTLVK